MMVVVGRGVRWKDGWVVPVVAIVMMVVVAPSKTLETSLTSS